MKNTITFFPELSKDHLDLIKPTIKYKFYYYPNGKSEVKEIENKIESNVIVLSIKDNDYMPQIHELFCRVTFEYNNGMELYGEDGIAPKNSKLGIALEYYSQKARRREVIISRDNIVDDVGRKKIVLEFVIPKATYRNDININIYCFLKEAASAVSEEESHLNNQVGVSLGTIDQKILGINGTVALFPIYFDSSPNPKNLWDLYVNYDDATIDTLQSSMKITIYSAHKDFKFLDICSKNYCDSLINNIIVSAVTVLIAKIVEENEIPKDIIYDSETLIGFVQYFKKMVRAKDDFWDIVNISKAVRNYVFGKETF